MSTKLDDLLKSHREEEAEPWLMSYADLVTLMFAFFVLLYSMSTLDVVKLEAISNYFSEDPKRMTSEELQKKIGEIIKNDKLEDNVNANMTSKGVEISFKDKLLFDSGKADVKPIASPVLTKMAQVLNNPDIADRKIIVEGHTDSIPIKTIEFPSNWELSSGRAASIVRFFIDQGLKKEKFVSLGYADNRPIVAETELNKGSPENRRVVVIITPESYQSDFIKRKEISVKKNLKTN